MNKTKITKILIAALLLISCNIFAENNSPKLTDVALYKNGLGYFQMDGKVKDNESFVIPVKDSQINDILSSLYVLDLNGGRIMSVGYSVDNKNDQDILIKLPKSHSLTELLKELQGAEIEIDSTSKGSCKGKLIGLEPVYDIVDNKKIAKNYIITLLDGNNSISPVLMSTVSSYKILDKTLQKDLNKLLDLSLSSKYRHRKNITISTEGKGIRSILIGYLVDTPVWKSTYRIIFNSEDDNTPLILGYAIAENTTENDWDNIKISFISGAPLSFIMKLSEPLFIERPEVPIPGLNFLNVEWNNLSGSEIMNKSRRFESKDRSRKSFAKAEPAMEMAYSDSLASSAAGAGNWGQIIEQTNKANTTNEKVGEMFAYNVENNVSVPAGQAAMIPIISEKIKGERIFYFNKSFSGKVSKAFTFKNDTKITFDSGPVTFFQKTNNLGEGIIKEVLVPDTQIVIPYAIAETVTMNSNISSKKSDYIKGKIVNGLLRLTYTRTLTTKWLIDNKSLKPQKLWIDQPVTKNYNLEAPKKADSIVSGNYRFKINLKSNDTTEFNIIQSTTTFDMVSLTRAKEDTLLMYSKKGYISDKDKNILKKLTVLLAKKTSLKAIVDQIYKEIKSLSEDQNRLRKNVAMLRNSRNTKEQQLKNKWIDKVAKSEEEIEKKQESLKKANEQLDLINKQIAKTINS
jgi:hypothetical protein